MSYADVFLTRHGARIDKEDRQWLSKAGHGRRDDPHLSAAGHLGARELAAKCRQLHAERLWAWAARFPGLLGVFQVLGHWKSKPFGPRKGGVRPFAHIISSPFLCPLKTLSL